jgi:hypothetical protein
MRETHHDTAQIFTLFGGAYVPESHGACRTVRERKTGSLGPMAAVLAALLVGSVTTAAAISVTSRVQATSDIWGPTPPPMLMKSPGMIGFEDALY